MPATFHEIKYGHPAALLHLRSHHLPLLNLFVHFSACAADALAIPISQPAMLPRERTLWTVPRSPFVHKKSQENFERIVYKRVIKAWDTNPQIIQLWEEYLKMHSLAGVGMRVVRWDRLPMSTLKASHQPELKVVDNPQRKVISLGKQIISKTAGTPQPASKQKKQASAKEASTSTKESTGSASKGAVKERRVSASKTLVRTNKSLTKAQKKRLERRIRREESLQIARNKLRSLPDRIGETMVELSGTVRRALNAVPRYDHIRPTVSAIGDLEKDWAEALTEVGKVELEGEKEKQSILERSRSGSRVLFYSLGTFLTPFRYESLISAPDASKAATSVSTSGKPGLEDVSTLEASQETVQSEPSTVREIPSPADTETSATIDAMNVKDTAVSSGPNVDAMSTQSSDDFEFAKAEEISVEPTIESAHTPPEEPLTDILTGQTLAEESAKTTPKRSGAWGSLLKVGSRTKEPESK